MVDYLSNVVFAVIKAVSPKASKVFAQPTDVEIPVVLLLPRCFIEEILNLVPS